MDQVQATLEEAFCKGCTRQSNNQAQPTNHARIKKPAPRQNKTKSLERAASKQASTKSITAK